MPPFLQFRLWVREGPTTERALTAVVSAVVLAVLIAALIPLTRGSDDQLQVAGAIGGATGGTTGGAGATGATGASGGGGGSTGASGGFTGTSGGSTGGVSGSSGTAGSGTGGTTGGTTSGGTGPATGTGGGKAACAGRVASAPGITADEVHIDVSSILLAGSIGNQTFDLRGDLHDIANALTADINQHGGVACGRKLVTKLYDVNPLNSSDTHAKCLEMRADNPFLVLDYASYVTPQDRACFVEGKLPIEASTSIGETEARDSYPYVFGPSALSEQMVHNGIIGLAKRGFFKRPGFTKLGILEDKCDPSVGAQIDKDLARVGVTAAQVSKFVLDCDVAAPPNQITAAVVQHKYNAHASHVFLATSVTNAQRYVQIAAGQSYHPAYGVSDYGAIIIAAGEENFARNFDGATGISTLHVGELNSGIRNAKLLACDRTLRRHGVPGVRRENKDTSALALCDLFAFFKAAIDGAGVNPTRLSYIQSLSAMGLFRSSLMGDGNFNRPGKVTGGDFQRPVQWRASCTCWKVLNQTMRPGYR